MQWIKDIVDSTQTLSLFWINSTFDMVDFVNPHTVIARKRTFSTLPSAWNRDELKVEVSMKKRRKENPISISIIMSF
jgi:hypothetical protein